MARIEQFCIARWMTDPAISMCAPATRGILVDLLFTMREFGGTGELSGTVEYLASVSRCSTTELNEALSELQFTGAADVKICGDLVTVVDRQMQREFHKSRTAALRSWISHHWDRLVARLARRDGRHCRYCGREDDFQIDHIIPVSKGGDNELKNLQLLCGDCNRRKSNKLGVLLAKR